MQFQRRITVVLAPLVLCAFGETVLGGTPENSPVHLSNAAKRIVHQFHFDERDEGNVEELPRYWTPLRGRDFPRYARGSFDESIGYGGAPSFRLESKGRNVAFQYNGPEIPVCSQSEYRVEGFVRMSGMSSSRVRVAAFFLDENMEPLLETMQRTLYIAQQPTTDWSAFDLNLSAAPAGAKFLGLILSLVQEPEGGQLDRGVNQVDVFAQAWFDDLSVYRLPRLEMTTGKPGEILDEHDESALLITLSDSLGQPVEADLEIESADGNSVLHRRVHGSGAKEKVQPIRIDVSGFGPGLYHARAEVVDCGQVVTSRSIQFLKLPSIPGAARQSRAFGVVIDSTDRTDWKTEALLLKKNAARSVKLPVASAFGGRDGSRGRLLESYCHDLINNHFLLGAALNYQPERGNGDWTSDVSLVAAQTAGFFRWWQLNEDGSSLALDVASWNGIAGELRSLLHQYISLPRLAAALSVNDALPNPSLKVEHVTVDVGGAVGLTGLSEKIAELKNQGVEEVSVFAPPLPADSFDRESRLGEWGKRLVQARHAGADIVFSPQMWHSRPAQEGVVFEPTEDYQIFHTVASVLGDAVASSKLFISDHIQCLSFRNAEKSVLAIWDDQSPPGGSIVPMQLGLAQRQVDLWGNASPLPRDSHGRCLIKVSQNPVFIDGVDSWLIDLATSFSIEPHVVESGTEIMQHELVINCPAGATRIGTGVLTSPAEIEATPRRFTFAACEGQPHRIPVTLYYPHNEPAGTKTLMANIELVDPPYRLEIPLRVEVRTTGIEVSGQAIVQHGELLLRHTVHNSSQKTASFRSIASVPGRQRQYRPLSRLGPGETQTIEYRFHDASDLIGRDVILAIRELDDGPRQHNLKITVP